ncbi:MULTISPECIES: M14 family zinc carboxypeptidase [Streptomyces]|uniref:M14 family zinc carboxypeptidase n=2 Tax=Streptomyces TaxID=1883 RepID=A0ABU2R1U1_9ACTN|nr:MULTISPECIES: M14 family zinc carboxypeptidase [unclassified Streptomyces]MDT0410652.1 M14 family zinc carboxypeptidase [Streptomyces sp. DSM 41979]MYQ61549.1 hydroxylacyl-CoA dehydrogenase [Streptomyces sp. SID4926]
MPNRLLTVAEVSVAARRLVSAHAGTSRLRRAGTSREGRPLLLLSVGRGARHVLVVAGAHADEPTGPTTALTLARRLLRGGITSPAADLTGVTWDFLLCLDPDAAALSRTAEACGGAVPAHPAHALAAYYRASYRPLAAEQPEWAPIEGRHLPETDVLLGLVDTLRPVVQCSLHNVDAGGTFLQLTSGLPGVEKPFARAAAHHGIPLQYGTFDALHWETPAPAVHVLPPPAFRHRLAAGSSGIGRATWCAPEAYGGTTAIIEVPLWASRAADDATPHPDPRAALRALTGLTLDGGRAITALVAEARPLLPADDPRLRVLTWMGEGLYELVASSWQSLTASTRLSAADVDALGIAARRQPLRAAGLLHDLLTRTTAAPGAPTLRAHVDTLLTTWCGDFARELALRAIPPRDQVGHQTATVVAAAEAALGEGGGG